MNTRPPFLTAKWLNLLMLNYEVDPSVLHPFVPAGCELDYRSGTTFVSVVAFQFQDTRLLGVPIPFHRSFEEVNLRFYVRRSVEAGWRRGVVFIKELVPRRALAYTARVVYGENYVALPMKHAIERVGTAPGISSSNRVFIDSSESGHRVQETRVSYQWKRAGSWEGVSGTRSGEPELASADAEETFITEHYWGYSRQRNGATVEYQVEHPRWRVWPATDVSLDCDVSALYGAEFVDAISGRPSTAFIADGSPVTVRMGTRL